ncbi:MULTISPECIES: aminopeptidase [Methylobacterium]|mgnify:CR=1 FL=1|jgi:aminopeptidase|uniref:aminopeptidase n=1 Tax=Methylobacterium TaxID=407 RepID=UPI0008DF6761|nr:MULTISPECIES: aminopeptidase [Methylobacterium]MBZ6416370.1 aminopeptidase [Methylobacterium sp.]MBK3399006.1 aminopeptidase [Methylobacterium ajmalii]MBK3411544.1 aminopeptidase [Methylobacterium ajmalii]MBK3420748.1 aminopeptidase [Methylobacterium ajmalii]SFF78711.1 aminopeptidase [Methylobacterium sp. yr596]
MTKAPDFDARLDRLAEVAVRVGLGLRPGQELVMTAPLDALPLARRITVQAYKAGASVVTTLLADDQATLARFEHGHDDAFDKAAGWLYEGMAQAYRTGAARLAISGDDPSLLAGQDTDKVARANRARSKAYMPALEQIANFATNWTIVSAANPAWARTVFPDLPEDQAVARLWDAIFAASRVDGPDPVGAWEAHNRALSDRTAALNARRYSALHFRGPGTDLTVGLADDHEWCGGATTAKNGIVCNANIPTEEVFTTPHCLRVQGHVSATKPLSYQGTLIDGIAVRFEEGRIVESRARTGADVLAKVIDTDEGARRLGEVALVPASSPISASGLLFCNTLYDENAASHIALGQAYSKCFLDGGAGFSEQDLAARGANRSLIHIDWMIGSAEVDVDGVTPDGRSEPLMRRGEWVD